MKIFSRTMMFFLLLLISACHADHRQHLSLQHQTIDAIYLPRIADYIEYWRDGEGLAGDHGLLLKLATTPDPVCVSLMGLHQDVDAGFVDAVGRLRAWQTLQVRSATTFCSPYPARWLLEMPPGWLTQHQIQAGAVLTVPSEINQP